MRKFFKVFSLFGLVVGLTLESIPASVAAEPIDPSMTASGILDQIDLAFEASQCNNVKSLLAFYSDDVVVYETSGNSLGKQAFGDYINAQLCLIDDPNTPGSDHTIEFDVKRAGAHDNFLWATGTYKATYPLASGALLTPQLRFTYIWEKDGAGDYKVVSQHTSGSGTTVK